MWKEYKYICLSDKPSADCFIKKTPQNTKPTKNLAKSAWFGSLILDKTFETV